MVNNCGVWIYTFSIKNKIQQKQVNKKEPKKQAKNRKLIFLK